MRCAACARAVAQDCEGCEWEAFADVARRSPSTLRKVDTIIFEVHIYRDEQLAAQAKLLKKKMRQMAQLCDATPIPEVAARQ